MLNYVEACVLYGVRTNLHHGCFVGHLTECLILDVVDLYISKRNTMSV